MGPISIDALTSTAAQPNTGGSITVAASGGVPPLLAYIAALNLTQQLMPDPSGQLQTAFLNIPAAQYPYTVSVSDTAGTDAVLQFITVDPYMVPSVPGCTDPAADNYDPNATVDNGSCTYTPQPRLAYFEVPEMQSLRFVQPGRTDKPALLNTLLADEQPLDYYNPAYCQKVEKTDKLVIQCLSNYQGAPVLTIQARDTNTVALTVPAVQVQQGAGQTAAFEVYIKPDPLPGFSRIYFNEDALPLPFLPGQRITVGTTGTSLDKTYPIHDVLEDMAAGVPYLRIVAVYPNGNIRIDGTLTTTYKIQVYDTYQFVIDLSAVASGCYVAQITAIDADFADALAVSEPIDLAVSWPDTKLVLYRNFDNDFGLNYSHGLVNRLRITGRFFDRLPSGEKTVLRNDDSELVLLSASVYRKVQLETLQLPGWLHEVLFVAFAHDFVKVDGVLVVLEQDYTYEPVERYTLGRGTALLEVRNFLGAGNQDDVGDPAVGGPLLLAKQNFLKVNPQ